MANPRARRHHAEIVERFLAPAQERITLHIALHFELHVILERMVRAVIIHHHRVVDDEIDRGEGVDALGVPAHFRDRIAHRREIHHGRYTGEILHQHPRRAVGDVARFVLVLQPRAERLDILARHGLAVFVAQQIFEQHFQREGQPRKIHPERFARRRNRVSRIHLTTGIE